MPSPRIGYLLYHGDYPAHHGTDNVKALANLAMLCGNVGVPGTGVNPLRGQNNVQGACDMGGLPNVFSGYQNVGDSVIIEKMEKAWGVQGLSNKVGLTLMEITEGAMNKRFAAFIFLARTRWSPIRIPIT